MIESIDLLPCKILHPISCLHDFLSRISPPFTLATCHPTHHRVDLKGVDLKSLVWFRFEMFWGYCVTQFYLSLKAKQCAIAKYMKRIMILAANCDTPPARSAKICTLMKLQSYCKWVAFSWHCPCLRIPQCRPKFCYCWRHLGINSPNMPKISLPSALTRITYDNLKELRDALHLASEPRIASHPREQGPASRATTQNVV